ncbi:prepilin peptidase [Pseudidiomarina gelatinasegens]|uniref:prepilin peptidase n=1 Tax=Pseudidiomarina gelatinasegens TaxID=2487740 RepID=UPI003A985E69
MDIIFDYPAHTWWVTVFGLLLGLVVGSFLNVVIGRFPVMMQRQWQRECAEVSGTTPEAQVPFNLATPNSHCPKCKTPIKWYDNIPVISWLLLRAKCRSCGTGISVRYPLIELLTGIVFALIVWNLGFTFTTFVYLFLTCLLISMFFIDADHMLLPDQMTYLMLWTGLGFAIYSAHIPLQDAVIGVIAGYLALWSVYWAFKLVTGKEGMGYGDFKLLAAFGAWHGYQMLPVTIIAAAGSGAVIGIAWQFIHRNKQGQPIPFGPFLICGGVIAMLWGEQILHSYLNWVYG